MSINPLKRNALSHIFGETTDFRFVLPAEKCRKYFTLSAKITVK